MFISMPYFKENESWYNIKKGGGFELTKNAPPKVKESFEEYEKKEESERKATKLVNLVL